MVARSSNALECFKKFFLGLLPGQVQKEADTPENSSWATPVLTGNRLLATGPVSKT